MRAAAVILPAALAVGAMLAGAGSLRGQDLVQQTSRKRPDQTPRALGLVRISSTGKARLTPIAILMNGKFFDAGSYKAAPVPMALDFGIVYEGFSTGVSQGLFTITQPGQLNHNWIAEGTWLPAGVKPPETSKKYEEPVIEDKDAPPVLHRRAEGASDKDESKKEENKKDAAKAAPAPNAAPPSTTPKAENREAKGDLDTPISDPNRPVLRRGKPPATAHQAPFANFDVEEAPTKSGQGGTAQETTVVFKAFPAISDAAGPDPRPYTYDVKPAEEAMYRTKMLELAALELQGPVTPAANKPQAAPARPTPSSGRPDKAKPDKAQFDNVSLRIFDLSSSNEPVLVLSAKTQVRAAGAPGNALPLEITLVARTDLEGELRKLFFARTDSRHLDVSPRMELIDAVDADGDGRAELLFRQTSEAGSAYAIYRVTADRLWSLWEGTP